MQTNYKNPTNFKSLYTGATIQQRISKEGKNSTFSKEVQSMQRFLRKNKIHKKENVDIILNHNGDSFYGVISSKTQGTPMHPNYRHPISKKADVFNKFKKWVDNWNQMYS